MSSHFQNAMPGGMPPMDLEPTKESDLSGVLAFVGAILRLFSTVRRREPPSPTKSQHIRLITVAASHYCEKARWGLDLLEDDASSPIYYTEDGHIFSAFYTLPASRGRVSQAPMIVVGSNQKNANTTMMYQSDVILREYCPFLYPPEIADEVAKMEEELGTRLGAGVRCFLFHHLLRDPYYATAKDLCTRNLTKVESWILRNLPNQDLDKDFRETLFLDAEHAQASEQAICNVFAELSELLRDGREYLMGKSFGLTAADLSLAALSYQLLRPAQMEDWLPMDMPPEIVRLGQDLANTLAGRHVLKVYAKHRSTNKDGRVEMRSAVNDRFPWKEFLSVVVIVSAVLVYFWRRY